MGLIRKKSIYETLEDLTSKFVKRIPTGFRKDSIKSHERNKGGNTIILIKLKKTPIPPGGFDLKTTSIYETFEDLT